MAHRHPWHGRPTKTACRSLARCVCGTDSLFDRDCARPIRWRRSIGDVHIGVPALAPIRVDKRRLLEACRHGNVSTVVASVPPSGRHPHQLGDA